MALFGFGKKTPEVKEVPCCFPAEDEKAGCCGGTGCSIKVLGAGCKSCHDQYEFAQSAVKSMGLDTEVEYVTDMEKVMAYGVMSMPAIVVNEKVVSTGKVLKPEEVQSLLKKLGC